MFHPLWRQAALDALGRPFDLVVIGGGINGCGIFLDAAQRGLRVLLVERDDLAAGTSSRSSKLIHGGLRYLKQLQWRVTRSSCRERDRQLRLAPHLVEPVRFVYPIRRGERPSGFKVEAGLWIYDRLTENPEKHAQLTAAEFADLAPGLGRERFDRILTYSDAVADDARLTLAVAATGFAHGGHLLTRARVEEGRRNARGRLSGLSIRDLENEDVHHVEAALVVNATGVWTDRLRHLLGFGGSRLRPSRGSHLIFPPGRLAVGNALTLRSPDDGRPVFFVAHPEGLLAGTTDLFHDDGAGLDDPRPSQAEVGYLLRAAGAAFPDAPPTLAEVRGAFAGVRPVLDAGATDPSEASREEAIWHEDGLLSVAGGKLTTWRLTAEEAVDRALELLPAERRHQAGPCATRGTPLAGLAPPDLAPRLAARHDLEKSVARGLTRRLGHLAWTACALASSAQETRPLAEGVDLCAAEVRTHLRFGAALHLSDLLLRRVRLGLWEPAAVERLLPELCRLGSDEAGWTPARVDQEMERFARDAEGFTLAGVRPDVGRSNAERLG